MKVYVMRHGLTEHNKAGVVNGQIDEPLAKEGFIQAKEASSVIPKTVKFIYCSALLRARQTAEIISSKLKLPIKIKPELSEINMGSLAGHAWSKMESGEKLKKEHRSLQFDYRKYGGESVGDVKKRVIAVLKEIRDKYQDKQILIVTHGGIIRLLYSLEFGKNLDEIRHLSLFTFDLDRILS